MRSFGGWVGFKGKRESNMKGRAKNKGEKLIRTKSSSRQSVIGGGCPIYEALEPGMGERPKIGNHGGEGYEGNKVYFYVG